MIDGNSSDVYYTTVVEDEPDSVQIGYNFDEQTRTVVQGLGAGAAQEITEFRQDHFAKLIKSSQHLVHGSERRNYRKVMVFGIVLSVVYWALGFAFFVLGIVITAILQTKWWLIFFAILGFVAFFVLAIDTFAKSMRIYQAMHSNSAIQAYLRPGNPTYSFDPRVVAAEEACVDKRHQILREENDASCYTDVPKDIIQRYYIHTWDEDKEIAVNGVKIKAQEAMSVEHALGVHQCDNLGSSIPALLCPKCANSSLNQGDMCFKCRKPSSVLIGGSSALKKAELCVPCTDDSLKYICVECYRFIGRGPRINALVCCECCANCRCVRRVEYVQQPSLPLAL